jgi:hypothetical protein
MKRKILNLEGSLLWKANGKKRYQISLIEILIAFHGVRGGSPSLTKPRSELLFSQKRWYFIWIA